MRLYAAERQIVGQGDNAHGCDDLNRRGLTSFGKHVETMAMIRTNAQHRTTAMPTHTLKPHYSPALLLVALFATLSYPAYSNELNGYMMSIQVNAPGIEHLRAGHYRKAIAASRSVRDEPGWRTAAYNNMCVAHTILKDYQRADYACAKTVNILRAAKARQRGSLRSDTTSLAMAYSNRGVLRALTGDLQGAEQDFTKARKYATREDQYEHNYVLLQWNLSISGVAARSDTD